MRNPASPTAALCLSLLASTFAAAQDQPKEQIVEISPAAVSKAALEHPLLPHWRQTTLGNAALLYLRAATQTAELKPQIAEFRNNLELFLDSDADDFPVEQARKELAAFSSVLGELRLAARRQSCEWQLPINESGTQLYYLLLPEMQALRELSRVLAVQIRIDIHDGRIDDAIDRLQTGYAMSRHIADAPFLINALVGVATSEAMSACVLELAQSEKSPNLYWSLTALPNPFIDMRQALAVESASALIVFPELVNADFVTGEASRVDFENFLNRFDKLASDSTNTTGPEYELRKRFSGTLNDEAAMKSVRSFLKSEGNYSNDAIRNMVPTQAVMIRERILYTRLRDSMFIHSFLPFNEARAGFDAWNSNYEQMKKDGSGLPLVALLLPGIDKACAARTRVQRRVASLRIIEAIRAYAAEHDGKLPDSLSNLSLPVANNPFDGKPFAYAREDNEATLRTDDGTRIQIQYRLRICK